MTQEDKLEFARQWYNDSMTTAKEKLFLEQIFPELKESEDEMIRKALIGHLKECRNNTHSEVMIGEYAKWIAWLEKKGEKKSEKWHFPYGENETVDKLIAIAECLEMDGDCLFNGYTGTECGKFLRDLARKQVECKSIDEVKPKFNVGDWITNGEYTWNVTDIKPLDYTLHAPNGNVAADSISYVDEHFNLWTVQDAKAGDVLVNDDDIFIFDGTLEETVFPFAYCGIINGDFGIYSGKFPFTHNKNIYPATKKQYNLLLQKMHEAGYEWDSQNKELKKES